MEESSVKFVGSTVTLCGSPPQSMMERIRAHISDPDNYEEGEPRPSMATLRRLETLVQDTRRINPGIFVRTPKISTFYGEIDLTWDTMRQMVRVIAHPNDQATELYILMKDDSPVPKGTTRNAKAQDLADAIQQVYSKTMAEF